MMKQTETKKIILDTSLWMVVLGNVISIALAITQKWDIQQILWVYWGQSVAIGVMNVYRMLSLKDFSTKNFKSNGVRPPETTATKISTSIFFAFHYGFFHFVYAVFLWQELAITDIPYEQLVFLILLIFGFFGSHGFSLLHNKNKDFKNKKPNIGTLMFYPYLRIIPMHLIIIFGSLIGTSGALIIFMLLKTMADAGMHAIEHHLFRRIK